MAQDFFRFAWSVGYPISFGLKVEIPSPPEVHIWGKHSLEPKDLNLAPATFELCGTILTRLAYRLLAMELDAALPKGMPGSVYQENKNHGIEYEADSTGFGIYRMRCKDTHYLDRHLENGLARGTI
jgi:hypothetical protein